jgi:hypothetical protein
MKKNTAVLKKVWSGGKGRGRGRAKGLTVYVGTLPHSALKTIKKSTDKFLLDNGINGVHKRVRVHIGWRMK